MGRKTPPFPSYPKWTTAKFWSFVRAGLRSKWGRWPPKYAVLKKAKTWTTYIDEETGEEIRYKTGKKAGEVKWFPVYTCNKCGDIFGNKEVQVDHIIPTGSLNCFEDLPGFVERLFVGEEGLQVLCSTCHQEKTNEERSRK